MLEEEVRITLRLPAELRDQLQRSAEKKTRSMNGEIVTRLDWSFKFDPDWFGDYIIKHEAVEQRLHSTLKGIDELEAENNRLRLELARTQGMNESLQHGVNVFMDRLLKAAGDKGVSMEDLLHAITKPDPQ